MNEEWLLPFKELIAAMTGLRIRSHDNQALSSRIRVRLSHLALNSPEDYYNFLAAGTQEAKAELKGLLILFTVGESYFFRDKGQFKLLKEVIVPELIERKSNERELRIWSAGCSTGEEAYSLAILIDELLPQRDEWKVSITGTDIREDFLKKAKAGVYGDWSFRQVDESIKSRYFSRKNGALAIDGKIKEMVSFAALDMLAGGVPDYNRNLYDLDLILCRNMFIYYNRQFIIKMLEKITDALAIGGYFMTAHGELFSLPLGLLKPKFFSDSVLYEKTAVMREASPTVPDTEREVKRVRPITPSIISRPALIVPPLPESQTDRPAAGAQEIQGFFKQGNYSRVIEKALALLKRRPKDYETLYLTGAAYANLGELEKAREYLQRALTVDSLSPEPYYLLALLAEEDGDREKAKEALNKAIYLKSAFVAAYLELASIYEYEGDVERAKKLYSTALAEVEALPANSLIDMYDDVTAGELAGCIKKNIGT